MPQIQAHCVQLIPTFELNTLLLHKNILPRHKSGNTTIQKPIKE